MILLSYSNSSIKGTEIHGSILNLVENLLFSTLILGSVFNDYVVFYGDLIAHSDLSSASDSFYWMFMALSQFFTDLLTNYISGGSEIIYRCLNHDAYPGTKPGCRANHRNTSRINRTETETSAKLRHIRTFRNSIKHLYNIFIAADAGI